jgi:DNA-binding GntR family transcriptional regulator
VSRSPVRDALLILVAEGLVEQPSSNRYQVIAFDDALIENVFTVRLALEPIALRQGIQRFGTSFLNSQMAFWSTLDVSQSTSPEWLETYLNTDHELHETIIATSKNSLLREVLEKVIRLGMAIRHWQHKQVLVTEEITVTIQEHMAIFEAVKAGAIDAAVEALTVHIENSQQRALSRFESMETRIDD